MKVTEENTKVLELSVEEAEALKNELPHLLAAYCNSQRQRLAPELPLIGEATFLSSGEGDSKTLHIIRIVER